MVQTGHLFAPMPDVIRDDMAFIDRLHFYLPGWEIPKMRNEFFTDHYGFVVDYLAEALRELRKHNFTESIDRDFALGAHLNARDRKAVRKTVSGLMKILHPHGEASGTSWRRSSSSPSRAATGEGAAQEDGLLRVPPDVVQLLDTETGEERFVGVPEQGGRDSSRRTRSLRVPPTRPVYADGTSVCTASRSGPRPARASSSRPAASRGAMKESIQRAFSHMLAKKPIWASRARSTRSTSTSRPSTF